MTPKCLIQLKNLAGGGRPARHAAKYFRTVADISEQQQVLAAINSDAPESQDLLTGVIKARGWNDTWKSNRMYVINNSQKALNWFTAVALAHKDALARHAQMREAVLSLMLTGSWAEASNVLRAHERELGPTLWGLRWRILWAQESGGTQARDQWVSLFSKDERGKVVSAFAHLFGITADPTLHEENVREVISSKSTAHDNFESFLELLFIDTQTRAWETWQLMDVAEYAPLLDRYEIILQLTSLALAQQHPDAVKLVRTLGRLAGYVDDPILRFLVETGDANNEIQPSNIDRLMAAAWDSYVASDYIKATEYSLEVTKLRPMLVTAVELFTKSSMYAGVNDGISTTTPIQLLRYHLKNIFSKNDNADDSLQVIYRFATRFRALPITAPLRALYSFHSSASPDERTLRRASYSAGVHGPRNFEYGHSAQSSTQYLNRYAATVGPSLALTFFREAANGGHFQAETIEAVAPIRITFFKGLYAARNRRFDEAIPALETFLKIHGSDVNIPLAPFASEEARAVLVNIFLKSGNIPKMLYYVAQSFIERASSTRRLPIDVIHTACVENMEEAAQCIEYPIVAFLHLSDPHKVCLALKRVLRRKGVTLPSQLRDDARWDVKTLAIFFLRVCTPEVMDSILGLDSDEKIEAERLLLLNWVSKAVSALSRAAETEVLRLTQQAQLREALRKIEGAKVVINITGLREAEKEQFAGAFHRFAARKELALVQTADELLHGAFEIIRKDDDGAVLVRPKHTHVVERIVERQAAIMVPFVSAFLEIRDTFISSPHFGLEACLSGRIRHGILSEHIHKPLVEQHLAYRLSAGDGLKTAEYWCARLMLPAESPSMTKILEILSEMTKKVDDIADLVRNSWIQSKTEKRLNDGLFDYVFTEGHLAAAFATVSAREASLAGADPFLDRVFDLLLTRTQENLSEVRQRIQEVLRPYFRRTVDEAIANLISTCDANQITPLRNALVACKQGLEQACHEMLTWFQDSAAAFMVDADLELIARTAVGMVERLNPEYRGGHQIEVEGKHRIRGRFFTALVHILFFLLENAIRYSGVKRQVFHTKVHLSIMDHKIVISVANRMADPDAAVSAALRIESKIAPLKVNLDPAKVIREGGTGFAKILAAVRYEFKQHDPVITATAEDCVLHVVVAFSTKELIV